jgi:hypothetical protein
MVHKREALAVVKDPELIFSTPCNVETHEWLSTQGTDMLDLLHFALNNGIMSKNTFYSAIYKARKAKAQVAASKKRGRPAKR